jgi:hypothetical protein
MGTGVEWHGFHAFRRGLGTRLYNNGTPIETVAKILRHGSGSEVTLSTTLKLKSRRKPPRCRACREGSRNEHCVSFVACRPAIMATSASRIWIC